MWIWRRSNNPYFRHLQRHNKRSTSAKLDPIWFSVGAGITINCCVVQGIYNGAYSDMLYFYCTGAIIVFAPFLLAVYAAWFTASDTSRPEYELFTLTGLSNQQLVWGYIYTLLYRLRTVMGYQIGFVLFYTAATSCFFITTVLFYEYPNQPEVAGYIRAFVLTVLCTMLGVVPVHALTMLIGVAAGLRLRHRASAIITAMGIALAVIIVWNLVMIYMLAPFSGQWVNFDPLAFSLTIVPLGLLWLTLQLAYRFAR